MGILKETGYSYRDLTIVPTVVSDIKSRSECNPYHLNGFLPIFTAPMNSVVCVENFKLWEDNKIIPILPRTIDWTKRLEFIREGYWVAVGLEEFETLFENGKPESRSFTIRILLDIANGHMKKALDLCKDIKSRYSSQVEIMAGNIANPYTYLDYCSAGIDYVRCSIGSGAGCLTTSNTGVHYPIATLIEKINNIKISQQKNGEFYTKVIADGGIRNYSDVIKALALGADYVMIGSFFSSLLESSAEIVSSLDCRPGSKPGEVKFSDVYYCKEEELEQAILDDWGTMPVYTKEWEGECWEVTVYMDLFLPSQFEEDKRKFLEIVSNKRNVVQKRFYGMSTKEAQKLMGKTKLKTSEGKECTVYVKYTIAQWVENMIDYLRSAMSYCGSRSLDDFIGNQNLIPNSPAELSSVNK